MPTYIMLSKLTEGGLETLKDRPERIKEVNGEIERMGAKVVAQYACLGEFDFLNILEAPDDITVARISVAIGARGSVHITTVPAIPVDEFIAALRA
jgi:uncharacterized protein with GYD domain